MDEAPRPADERERRLPSVFYNPITLIGSWIAAVSLVVILFLMGIEATSADHNPYAGITTFVVLPIFLILGLVLIAVGALREQRRRRSDLPPTEHLPIIDMNRRTHRRAFSWIVVGSVIFLGLSAFGSFKAYEYTETNEFCGAVCHTVMDPEYTAYQASAHARVNCVECHIGSGAEWFVKSKISGAYQVYAVLADVYPRPIPTPIENLRPSADTCEQCHWPEKFYDQKLVTHDYFLPDEQNTHMSLDMLMKIGGGSDEHGQPTEGIHAHMYIDNKIEYYASDERRQEIPWIRVTHADGSQRVFIDEEADFDPAEIDESEIREMDCIDCHNRPSHNYKHPGREVNQSMARGEISPSLPYIKSVAVDALEGEYGTKDEALAAIESSLREHFEDYPEIAENRPEALENAIATVQRIYRQNYFPTMGVSWEGFPDNIGHLTAPGCFRCHDGMHTSEDDVTISRDCTVCHTLLAQEFDAAQAAVSLVGVEYQHPEDIDEAWKEIDCTECHAP